MAMIDAADPSWISVKDTIPWLEAPQRGLRPD